jgi:hypothetical protein
MKILISQVVYNQFDDEDRAGLTQTACHCMEDGRPDPACASCDGVGIAYEYDLSPEDSAAIQENLRRQGVPLGKIGAH